MFHPFLDDKDVAIYGVEAGGHGLDVENGHAASMTGGSPGVLHGNRTYLLQDSRRADPRRPFDLGRPRLSGRRAGAFVAQGYRAASTYVPVTDKEALEAFQLCTTLEGIIPALEPATRSAQVMKLAPKLPKDNLLVVNLSGRGDKDVFTVAEHLGMKI